MKRNVFTLFVFIVMSSAASAQTEMGSWLIGGNLELNTGKDKFQVSPMAGYFLINNFAVGGLFDFNYSNVLGKKTTDFGFGPFARYYFGQKEVRPLLHAQWNYISTKTTINTVTATSNGSQLFFAGGLAAFINRNIALEGLAGYDYTNYRHATEDGAGGFRFKVGFQVYLSGSQMSQATGN